MKIVKVVLLSVAAALVAPLAAGADTYAPYPGEDFPRQVYWGDTHLHTSLSPDAYLFGNVQLTPDDAYRFARGETLTAHNGMKTRLRRPLDFLAVADHGEYLGVFPALVRRDPVLMANETGLRWADGLRDNPAAVMAEYLGSMVRSTDIIDSGAFERSVWGRVIENAERHNDPGQFTAFVAYEYTPTYKNTIGDVALTVVWKDPDFDPAEHSFYYVRVIEIPKPRWTTYDAVRLGAEIPAEVPKTTQDRAYTSPIWYTPPGK